jgi:hypothetical protein
MFKHKNALISLAVALLVAACGGGGGGDTAPATPPANTGGNTDPGGNVQAPQADPLAGHLTLSANQVAKNGALISLSDFANPGAYGIAPGTAAPIESFGIRVLPALEANQSKTVRVAVDLTDSATGAPQALKLLLDKVTFAVDANNVLSVTVPADAKAYVYAKNSAGTVNASSTGALGSVVHLVDGIPGDTASRVLTVNIDEIVGKVKATPGTAQPVFAALPTMVGKFAMNVTLSNVTLQSEAEVASAGETVDVTGSGQAPVTGGGVKGFAWLNSNPPQ